MARKQGTFGAVAAGHEETAVTAVEVLKAGGNAFDAAVAAMATACVTEPVLASLGGGGFLLARTASAPGEAVLYDFFTQTPKNRHSRDEIEFFPVLADFGTATQEFHIGAGACATPGMAAGMSMIQHDLCRMAPMDHFSRAIGLARNGVRVNDFQSFLFGVVSAIYDRDPESIACFGDSHNARNTNGAPAKLAPLGALMQNPDLGATLAAMAHEGCQLFSHGEIASEIGDFSRDHGGHLSKEDLAGYRVEKRAPLCIDYKGARILTNPAPSTGGLLIAFALRLMEKTGYGQHEDAVGGAGEVPDHKALAQIMAATNRARVESGLSDLHETAGETLLDADFLATYEAEILGRPQAPRGTTHISIVDAAGNAASVTLSNGEGCGRMLPGRGFMLNNMLGEEDINPLGFNAWAEDVRLCSMMSPSLMLEDRDVVTALGSGGSNRIRTAVLQVISNILDNGMDMANAVCSPRMHYENGVLNIEGPRLPEVVQALASTVESALYWEQPNLFFGGVHAVQHIADQQTYDAIGDPRRGGHALVA